MADLRERCEKIQGVLSEKSSSRDAVGMLLQQKQQQAQ